MNLDDTNETLSYGDDDGLNVIQLTPETPTIPFIKKAERKIKPKLMQEGIKLDELQTIGIIGDRHTGKTNLLFNVANNYKGKRKIFLYGYPKEILNPKTKKNFMQIHSLNELELLTNSIVLIDELHKQDGFKFYDTRTNTDIMDVLSTIAHANNTIIFTTQLTQFLTKTFDGFINGFLYTKLSDLDQLKNGSKAKRLLKEFSCHRRGTRTLRLEPGEYLQIVDGQTDNGLKTFVNQNIGKDWIITG